MKNFLCFFLVLAAFFLFACGSDNESDGGSSSDSGGSNPSSSSAGMVYDGPKTIMPCPVQPLEQGPVQYYGKLKVREGTPFIDGVKNNGNIVEKVQVRGVSLFWSQWGGKFYNANAVERLAKDWKAEVVRAAYGATGYATASASAMENRELVKTVVEAAIKNDIYAIIDWHSHNAAKTEAETQRAKEFFAEMAQIYGGCDNVIFELYNEPTGVAWATIKSYSEEVIPEIRKYSENLILAGTPTYSQEVETVIGNAINDENIGYVLHFYAASHSLGNWRDNINSAINNKVPIFVTEYGTTHADGGCSPLVSTSCGGDHYNSHNAARADEWHNYMDTRGISSAVWSVFDKYEGSALFGTVPNGTFDQSIDANWSDTDKMTESGKYSFKKLNCYYLSAPWNPNQKYEDC